MGCAYAKVTLFPCGRVAEVLQMSDTSSHTWLLLHENFYCLVGAKASLTVRKDSKNYLGAKPILLSPITHLCWKGAWVWFINCLLNWVSQPVLCPNKSVEVFMLSFFTTFHKLWMPREYWAFKRLVLKPELRNCFECEKCWEISEKKLRLENSHICTIGIQIGNS